MKKLLRICITGLVCLVVFSIIFFSIDFAQAQMKTQAPPPGKDKDKPNPKTVCNDNLNCEYEEYDFNKSEDEQPCPDCLPRVYGPLLWGTLPQIAGFRHTTSDLFDYRPAKVYQVKWDGNTSPDTGGYAVQWESLELDQVSHGVVIGDIDNDGAEEIAAIVPVITTIPAEKKGRIKTQNLFNHELLIFEQGSGTEEPVRLPLIGEYGTLVVDGAVIADVDNIVPFDNELIVFKSGSTTARFEVYKIVVVGGQHSLSRVYYDEADCNSYLYTDGGIWGLEVGDVDGDQKDEILLSRFNTMRPFILNFTGEYPYYWEPVEDSLIDEIPASEAKFDDGTINFNVMRIADTNNNGIDEIIAGTNNDRLYIWEYDVLELRYKKIFSTDDLNPSYSHFTWALDVGDVDGDTADEIVVGIGAGGEATDPIRIFQYNGDTWIQDPLLGESGRAIGLNDLRVADLDGTSPAEIITGQNGLTIYRYDPISHSFLTLYNYARGSSFKIK